MKLKFDSSKVLPLVVFGLGAVTTLLTNKINSNERATMKTELKDELLKELTTTKD